jgi:hypothetical protein
MQWQRYGKCASTAQHNKAQKTASLETTTPDLLESPASAFLKPKY